MWHVYVTCEARRWTEPGSVQAILYEVSSVQATLYEAESAELRTAMIVPTRLRTTPLVRSSISAIEYALFRCSMYKTSFIGSNQK